VGGPDEGEEVWEGSSKGGNDGKRRGKASSEKKKVDPNALEAARVGETGRGGAAAVARILPSRPTGVPQGLLLSWRNVI